jgi:hypothetical protein
MARRSKYHLVVSKTFRSEDEGYSFIISTQRSKVSVFGRRR